ncbi:hypothetical protein [Poseidonibacter lekithochrous]|uniref:hypothetical protein n=1 Tax=Poseidonibacter lekithochrous TaxID=1904463 RepID=UPI0008FC7070|nr:hypothetical protein [Poseidonibacter lekithochrous]QKJ22499.1 RND family efflux system, membrane fusion protein [Poseidonibacter lekithochrous]
MKKILTFALLSFTTLFAKEYMAQIKTYEMYEIKSQTSGIINIVNKNLESKYIKNKELLIKIDSKDEEIDLQKNRNSYEIQKEIVKIKEQNYKAKKRISQLSLYDKNNEKLSFLEAKKELSNLGQTVKKLENEISKKTFVIKNRYIDKIFVDKGEYVNIGDKLFNSYDITKLKISLFLSQEEIKNIDSKALYIENKKSYFKVDKIHKIKDENKISRYKVEFIKDNTKEENYFFDKVVKVELK